MNVIINHTKEKEDENITGDETMEETDVYVKIYTDGTLAFSNADDTIDGKTLSKSYRIEKGTKITSRFENPWYDDRSIVKNCRSNKCDKPSIYCLLVF